MTPEKFLRRCGGVHSEWSGILEQALATVDNDYLHALCASDDWLPGMGQLFNAFQRDRQSLRYVLIGESPYPRVASANGIAFYDAAVSSIWSETGLSKAVNRATSLRNIIKTALLAEAYLKAEDQGKISQASIARIDKSGLIENLSELFDNLHSAGFLMLNATPVLHAERKPAQEARYWQGFLECLLRLLAPTTAQPVTLILWGKIAESIEALDLPDCYARLISEHPYNLSFIQNQAMQTLFRDLAVLTRRPA